MKPIQFKEQAKELKRPASLKDKECGSLPVYNDGRESISCWKSDSFVERIKFLFSGKMWLGVVFGRTQPPVYLTVEKPFPLTAPALALVIAQLESDGAKARLNIYIQSLTDMPLYMGNSSFLLNYPQGSLINPELEFSSEMYSTGDYEPIEVKALFDNKAVGVQLRCSGKGAEIPHQLELLCRVSFEQTSEAKLSWRSKDTAVVSSTFVKIPSTFIIK